MSGAETVLPYVDGQNFEYEGDSFQVTISIGVNTLNNDGGDEVLEATELIKLADANLYAAKHGGRNRVVG